MPDPIPFALRILAHFWLAEVRPDDLVTIEQLPELAGTLPAANAAALIDLAVAYQRLFGFNLPAYESVFVDPAAMLMAPATARVEALYRQANWQPPQVRAGAPDHLGLELLALADWLETGQAGLARQLLVNHLALWAPALSITLQRLDPPPFYTMLAELTLDLLLSTLPTEAALLPGDPFPALSPAPVYSDQVQAPGFDQAELSTGLPEVVNHLLTPCQAGLYLAREDIAHIGQALGLPAVIGERSRMLETLFRLAGQYELVPNLLRKLARLLNEAGAVYGLYAEEYPAWAVYAGAWRRRLASSRKLLALDTD